MVLQTAKTYKTQSPDTSVEVERLQFQGLRKFPLWKRAAIVTGLTQSCLEMCLIGIRQQYPDATAKKMRQELAKRTLEPQLAALICTQEAPKLLTLSDPIGLALQIASILESLDISYVIGGSLASSLWGEPRSTNDIHLVADLGLEKVALLVEAVQSGFYISEEAVRAAISHQSSFNLLHLETMAKVDIFVLQDQAFPQSEFARRRAAVVRNPEQILFLPSPEDIILQKLIWYQMGGGVSDKQWRDVLGVIKLQGQQLDFAYLQQWAVTLNLTELLATALGEAGYSYDL